MAEAANPLRPASGVEGVEFAGQDLDALRAVLEPGAWARLVQAGSRAERLLRGRRLWNVNSTANGGGVAELLAWFLPLLASAKIDVRWLVLNAPHEFFELTKRVHHLLHESARPLGAEERESYEGWLRDACAQVCAMVAPGDVVVVHDPQPAGLIPALAAHGAAVIWRCHVGTDTAGARARQARDFLEPYVRDAHVLVFSRRAFVWDGLPPGRACVVQPAIDPLAPKNQQLSQQETEAILQTIGVRANGTRSADARFRRADGRPARVTRPADILQVSTVPASAPIVTQVSRWDALKDPVGVLEGFAAHVPKRLGAHLVLAGPAVSAVTDDPEGRKVLQSVRERWQALPPAARERIHVATLPMEDTEENAAMVNALQRTATVVVQKSLREGFGLTVAEALWKGRPVVASRAGGIQEQIEDGRSGLLLQDPTDLRSFGAKVAQLLGSAQLRERLGRTGHRRVVDEFLPDRMASDWADVIELALGAR